jgi:tetratricopeptide (TPR) repeat protein
MNCVKPFFFIGLLFLAGCSINAQAVDLLGQTVTEAELKTLPPYCKDTEWFPERYGKKREYWISRMGPSFYHMHHYCWALFKVNRSLKSGVSKQSKTSLWQDALNDYNYILHKATPDFVLLPEIYTKLGILQLLRREPTQALEAFSKAQEIKPDYWPSYSHWVEFLIKSGKRNEALEFAAKGLKHSPNAKVLQEQYRLLGGKLNQIQNSKN